jgi:hypothetical protein
MRSVRYTRFRARAWASRVPRTNTPGSCKKRRRTETELRPHLIAISCTVRNRSSSWPLLAGEGRLLITNRSFVGLRAFTRIHDWLYSRSPQSQSEFSEARLATRPSESFVLRPMIKRGKGSHIPSQSSHVISRWLGRIYTDTGPVKIRATADSHIL